MYKEQTLRKEQFLPKRAAPNLPKSAEPSVSSVPTRLTPAAILQMQQRQGNAAVRRMLNNVQRSPGAVISVGRSNSATIQRMVPCPPHLADNEPTPPGWQDYHGNSAVFHCGFRGILENRHPTPEDPMNECFYDHSGTLVDANHPFAGCRGTPDQYDSKEHPLDHTFRDSGGIWAEGGPAFITSRIYELSRPIAAGIEFVQTAGRIVRSVTDGIGAAIAQGILAAKATVDPGNWTFQGLPARSIRHLNVMGSIIGSSALAGNVQTLLQNLTRRLDSFLISGLLDDLAQDINQALQDRSGQPVTAATLGQLSLIQLVEFLRTQGLIQYRRPPEDIAREQFAAQPATAPQQ